MSWRDGRVSDWTVTLGGQQFQLHRWQLIKASGFFEGQFNKGFEAAGTDLTKVLPKAAWPAFEVCWDYIYGEMSHEDLHKLEPKLCLPLLKIADVLEIDALLQEVIVSFESLIDTDAIALASNIDGLLEGEADKLHVWVERILEVIRHSFQWLLADDDRRQQLLQLPSALVKVLLSADRLAVRSEDEVFQFIRSYMQLRGFSSGALLSLEEEAELWCLVRVPHLSASSLLQLQQMGLEAKVGLPVQHGAFLRLARDARDREQADRLLGEEPRLHSWSVPRLPPVIHAMPMRKPRFASDEPFWRQNPDISRAFIGDRPLPDRWLEGKLKSFEFCLDATSLNEDEDEKERFPVLAGICFDDPHKTCHSAPNWNSVNYLAVNSMGELFVRGNLICLVQDDCGRKEADDSQFSLSLAVGDIVQVCITEGADMLIFVNGIARLSAPLDASRCLCENCLRGAQKSRWLAQQPGAAANFCQSRPPLDWTRCDFFPMVGIREPSTVLFLNPSL
ncbi:unnamed protein product [Polarella glacialis]|uniref:BTB domain-containing protein n=1 Tax=Polarella glacialis TaxID=89957 RepID=A0A813HRV9_POLGL|nr:unnamed protein product [Polarella glacialis]